jgi:ubiquinone/menaquinone biosynthesis C-methylase UbiE
MAPEDPQRTPDAWGAVFDRAVEASSEASVALYCLGRTDLLHAATDEILRWMQSRKLLTPRACVLDVGCGSGRIVEAIAQHVGTAVGIDISMRMLHAARERCAGYANALFVRASGRDLSAFQDSSIDLICAVDVFPYFVMSGLALAYVGEAARVLRPDGHLMILNFAYHGDAASNLNELRNLARGTGLSIRYSASREFSLWDGTCFLLQKSDTQERSK